MKALLQKSCKECTQSSIQTYFYNIKALAKVGGHTSIPTHSRWINDALLKKIKKLPLMRFKNLSIAAVKALKAYGTDGTKREKWSKEMSGATERYAKQRNKQERTEREAKNWPKGGYAAIGKLADELHEEVAPILKGARDARRALAARALVRRALLLEARASGRPRGRSGSEEGTKLH